jgi:hypothetical protein
MRFLVPVVFFLLTSFNLFCQCSPSGIPEFTAEIVARSSGNSFDVPFIAGEEVFVRISFNTNRDSTARLLHGLIPTFGPGWDYNKINFTTFHPIFGIHNSSWISMDGNCPPFVKKDIPTLCTYYDINGNLQLCHLECETCPCSEGLKMDDALPSGWFWIFQPTGCNYFGECLLPESYGPWGVDISHNGRVVNLDILLTVVNNSNVDSCELRTDLSIGLQEIYDDITGCFYSVENSVSIKFLSENWIIDCSQPAETNKFKNLKVIIYHDENIDGVRSDDEKLITGLNNFGLVGDSISDYSEVLQYYLLTGTDYKAVCDTNNFMYNFALSTESSIDVDFSDGEQEKTVEFGVYVKPTSVNTKNKWDIIAFPNPVVSELTIHLPQGKHVLKLTNAEGSIIYEKDEHSIIHSINTNEFASGIYYLSILDENFNLIDIQKVVKN